MKKKLIAERDIEMRAIIQRVKSAEVSVNQITCGKIGQGLLILLGIEDADGEEDIEWLTAKIASMRIFSDDEGKMNLSVNDINGDLLVVSQFTLFASTKKGNRPSFIRAARPQIAIPLYEQFCSTLNKLQGKECQKGIFGADMQVQLTNDGPVTIIIDSKAKE